MRSSRPSPPAPARMVGPASRARDRLYDHRDRSVVPAGDGILHAAAPAVTDYDFNASFAPPLIALHRALHRLVPILRVLRIHRCGARDLRYRRDRRGIYRRSICRVGGGMGGRQSRDCWRRSAKIPRKLWSLSFCPLPSWVLSPSIGCIGGALEFDSLRDCRGARADAVRPGRDQFCLSRARHRVRRRGGGTRCCSGPSRRPRFRRRESASARKARCPAARAR